MSGTTSSWSQAKVLPERARPDWISSATISTLRSVQSARRSRRKPSGGMTTPPSPWIGSKSTADGRLVDGGRDGVDVAVRRGAEARGEGGVAAGRDLVVGEADDGGGAAVEVALHGDDRGLAGGDALDLVAPLAADLDRGLDGLGAGVHRQDHVLAGEAGQRLGEAAELVVEEGAAGERQPAQLLARDRDQALVAVTEVERGVAREAVEVAATVDVDHPGAVALGEHHRQGVVVVRGVALGGLDVLGGARCCVEMSVAVMSTWCHRPLGNAEFRTQDTEEAGPLRGPASSCRWS